MIRPFIIVDRVLDLTVGSETADVMPEESLIQSQETIDMMSLLSGRKLGIYLSSISDMVGTLKELAEA